MTRLVMIHGVCWGIGQSTLAQRLADAITDADVLWEDQLSQPSIFARPEFDEVAEQFRRHNAHPTAGVGHPGPRMLEDAYRRLVDTVLTYRRTTLMAWSVMDLAEDLDWAQADESALREHALRAHEILSPLDPALVYLTGDLATAIRRAIQQRGKEWFHSAYGRPAEVWEDLEPRLLAQAAYAAARIDRAFAHGGWFPAVTVDATATDAEVVFASVVEELPRYEIPIVA